MEEKNVSQDTSVCRHYQTGYCKYGSQSGKTHFNNICQKQGCISNTCTDKHPRTWKYFANNGHCRYKDQCAYIHPCSNNNEKQGILENEITTLEDEVVKLSKIIANIIEKLNKLEPNFFEKEQEPNEIRN